MNNSLAAVNSRSGKEPLNLSLYTLGIFVSMLGTSIYTFAIGLHVLKLTGSGLSFAATLLFGLVPMVIFNPVAGVIADRFDKKKIVVIMDSLNGVLFISLYIASSFSDLNLIMIYTSAFLTTVFTTIFGISMESAKPNIVSDDRLMQINSASKIVNSISSILGPVLGGMVFAFIDIRMFILINGCSFIFSAISEVFLDFKYNLKEENKSSAKAGFMENVKEGFEFLSGRSDIKQMIYIFVVINFFTSLAVSVPMPFIINNVLKLGSKEFGIIESAFPIGMIIGAVFVERVIEKVSFKRLLISMSIVMAVSMISMGIPLLLGHFGNIFYLLYYSLITLVFGIAIAFIDIPVMYLFQKLIPGELRGRVLSIAITMAKIIAPIALIISGALINKIPSYTLPMAGGSLMLAANLIILNKTSLRDSNF